jgi:hypothetical protein
MQRTATGLKKHYPEPIEARAAHAVRELCKRGDSDFTDFPDTLVDGRLVYGESVARLLDGKLAILVELRKRGLWDCQRLVIATLKIARCWRKTQNHITALDS